MKLVNSISLFVLVFGLGLFVVSCAGGDAQNSSNDEQQEETMHEGHDHDHDEATTEASAPHGEGKEYTSAYVCPMHCPESGSEEAGNCPKCGMAYVPLAEHTKNGHTH